MPAPKTIVFHDIKIIMGHRVQQDPTKTKNVVPPGIQTIKMIIFANDERESW